MKLFLVYNAASELFAYNSVNTTVTTRASVAVALIPHYNGVDVRKYLFSERFTRVWISLPAEQKHFSSLLQFKASIISTHLTQFVSLGF